ncbi:MAG: dihydrodipicolinate synthase family protein [Fimbriimonadaceae bacterium]|nr:dihydrodipicolinate synthase family protein [Fimbriimonadaceae bacterium]
MTPTDRFLVPLVSAFTDDTTAVSEVRTAKLVRAYRDLGAAGFVVGTDMAEWPALALSERKEAIEWVMRESQGLPVYVAITAFTTSMMIDLCQHGARHGARAAVLSLPPGAHLSPHEIKNMMNVVRRHGQLPVSLLDAPERLEEVAEELGLANQGARPLASHDLGGLQVAKSPSTIEFVCADGFCTPMAVLGASKAETVFRSWHTAAPVAQGLWRLAGPVRLGKAAAEALSLEVGAPRGPALGLDDTGRTVLKRLFDLTAP